VPKYDPEGHFQDENADIDVSLPITHFNFEQTLVRYPIVVVNFFAPWCHWCQRLEPTWEAATKEVHEKYPEWDGRIRFAKVDCTAEVDLCRSHFIQGFPSIRVFRKGHDEINVMGRQGYELYTGDRTKEALVGFADALVPSAGEVSVDIPLALPCI
jgi:thioredoxin-like negative regulator of GroEL